MRDLLHKSILSQEAKTITKLRIMAKVQLIDIAHGRSGDKGDGSNVGIIARHPDVYPFLKEKLTSGVVKEHMKNICKGEVERYELPNIGALNFVLHKSLGGGGTVSLKLDAQGKTHASMLLRMEIEVPDELLQKVQEIRITRKLSQYFL